MGLVVVFVVLAVLVLLDRGPSIMRWHLAARRARKSPGRQAAAPQQPVAQRPGVQPVAQRPGVRPVAQRPGVRPVDSRSWPAAGSDSEREEAALVAELLAGNLPAARYRRLMADLAARDASRKPLVVPPQIGDR